MYSDFENQAIPISGDFKYKSQPLIGLACVFYSILRFGTYLSILVSVLTKSLIDG